MNTVIYILCLLMIVVIVILLILVENLHKCSDLIKKFEKEHQDIYAKLHAALAYTQFIGDSNELLLWKIRYDLFVVQNQMASEEKFELAEKVKLAILRADDMINFYRKNFMTPRHENNNNQTANG